MSFLAPAMLVAAALAAAAAVVLHLLTTQRPPAAVLPTARFVPVSDARAVARSSRPTDLLLLACRVMAALLLGAAFAQPVRDASGPAVRAVVMLDRSGNVADAASAARLARLRLTPGGALVVFDTGARELSEAEIEDEGLRTGVASSVDAPRAAPGILSAAFLVGTRAGRRVARGADSVRLVLVSPLAEEEFDAATSAVRDAWPGGVELVRVPARTDSARGVPVRLVSALADDPLAPALARLDQARGAHEVRIVRAAPSAADSAWASEAAHVLVHWPSPGPEEAHADGVTAFGARAATLVAPLVRLSLGTPLEMPSGIPNGARTRVIARWRDGATAATESPLAEGCVRSVGVGIPLAGDLTLRAPFDRFLATLVEPCGGARGRAVTDSVARRLAGDTQAASAPRLAAGASADADLAVLMLALALVALGAESLLRRRRSA
ncbi:MAG: BatA domain-containing protein [Gemmatimonadetes bacterium]|nr:BatA domain-containing protein [Gemmatimonadota bacterium]